MTETRLLTLLALSLIGTGSVLLTILTGSAPPEFEASWLYLLFAAVALFAAGLGVFLAMVASAIAGLVRLRHAERAAR